MKSKRIEIKESFFPKDSALANEASVADFYDAYRLSGIEKKITPLEAYFLMVERIPYWIKILLLLRNKIAKILGLQDVGNLGREKQHIFVKNKNLIGVKLDFFIIDSYSNVEMILTLKDKHLDIKISILKSECSGKTDIIFSTLVSFNNYFGKIYMFIIAPFHKIIIKRLMQNIR